jgi:hypothetical protein
MVFFRRSKTSKLIAPTSWVQASRPRHRLLRYAGRDRPAAQRGGHRLPTPGEVGPLLHGRVGRLGDLAHRVVPVDDQRGEQVVAAGEVPVQRRGDHPHVPGDGAQREVRAVRRGAGT